MTEQERIDREVLLKRAATAAGALYVAPVLTSSAAAEANACAGLSCSPGRRGDRNCKRKGGKNCRCLNDTCSLCGQDLRCGAQQPCEGAHFCNDSETCICWVLANSGGQTQCVQFHLNFCTDYPPCDKNTGKGCPPGWCCLDTCCPKGICEYPCTSGAAARIARTVGSGPRPYL